jgi:hypothetical protein
MVEVREVLDEQDFRCDGVAFATAIPHRLSTAGPVKRIHNLAD